MPREEQGEEPSVSFWKGMSSDRPGRVQRPEAGVETGLQAGATQMPRREVVFKPQNWMGHARTEREEA